MIGNDEINANAPCRFSCLKSPDASIYTDDNSYPARSCPLNHVILNAVTFFDPMRDMKIGSATA